MSRGRYALAIAADTFEDPGLRRLLSPTSDVAKLASVLRDPQVGDFDVQEVINEPSHRVGRVAQEFFTDRRRDDLLLVYYSGHGLKDISGQLYFASPNTELAYLGATALSARFLNELMTECRARTKILLLDCCHSGAFAKGMTNKSDLSVHTAERFEGQGRIVLTASDAVQFAFEGDDLSGEGVRSTFTRFLTEGLVTGDADLGGDGHIDVDELYDYVYERVVTETPAQRPHKWAWDVSGQVIIARSPGPSASLPVELQLALESPFTGVRLGAVEELSAFLSSGDQRILQQAAAALRSAVEDDSRRVSEAATRLLGAGTAHQAHSTSAALPATAASRRSVAANPGPARERDLPAREGASDGGAEIRLLGAMIHVPAGPFTALRSSKPVGWLGRESTRTGPREVTLPEFWIAKFPVTNDQYALFVSTTGRQAPRGWDGAKPPPELLDHPVVNVSWAAANAYCAWVGHESGKSVRLPSAAEWEKAARGTDNRRYPWGRAFDAARTHSRSRRTAPVSAHAPAGDSPYGVSDLVGNAREWTADLHGGQVDVRGGGFLNAGEGFFECGYRDLITPAAKASIGFRIAYS